MRIEEEMTREFERDSKMPLMAILIGVIVSMGCDPIAEFC